MIPTSAPNLHPFVIHFPIALLVLAVVLDLVDLLRSKPGWLAPAGAWLYVLGAVSALAAYFSGQQATTTIAISEAAQVAVTSHENWALGTTAWFGLVAALRFALLEVEPQPRHLRWPIAIAGILGLALLASTADRGGGLVYQHGLGVSTQTP